MHHFNSRIAAVTGTRHLEVLEDLNQIGFSLAAEAVDLTGSLLRAARTVPPYQQYGAVVEVVNRHYLGLYRSLFRKLATLARSQHGQMADSITARFPVDRLGLVAIAGETEDDEPERLTVSLPNLVHTARAVREPAYRRRSKKQQREDLRELVMPDLPPETVRRIVLGSDEETTMRRIAQQTQLADPTQVANTFVNAYSQGLDRREITRKLRPVLQNNRSAAYRVARTEGARVANTANMEAYEQLGDLILGFQIHAVLDERTRPLHRQRNGRIYYKRPGPDQFSVEQMPHPPQEADGTVAPFCRCWTSPVFADVPNKAPALDFTNAEGRVIPDPVTYGQWFRDTTPPLRRKAVGAKRYAAMEARFPGRQPDYFDFVDTEGELLNLERLKEETNHARIERRNALLRLFTLHRTDRLSVLLTGLRAPKIF